MSLEFLTAGKTGGWASRQTGVSGWGATHSLPGPTVVRGSRLPAGCRRGASCGHLSPGWWALSDPEQRNTPSQGAWVPAPCCPRPSPRSCPGIWLWWEDMGREEAGVREHGGPSELLPSAGPLGLPQDPVQTESSALDRGIVLSLLTSLEAHWSIFPYFTW